MENSLGLTEHHKYQILELLRYSRYKRKEKVIGIELAFQDFVDTRVMEEDTFTQDEVSFWDLFASRIFYCLGARPGQRAAAKHRRRSRIRVNQLMRCLRTPAAPGHAASRQMETQTLLRCKTGRKPGATESHPRVRAKREWNKNVRLSSSLPTIILSFSSPSKLTPIQGDGPIELLQKEIDRMSLENQNLKEKNANLEERLSSTISEKTKGTTTESQSIFTFLQRRAR